MQKKHACEGISISTNGSMFGSYKHKVAVYELYNLCEVYIAFNCLCPNNAPQPLSMRSSCHGLKKEPNSEDNNVLINRMIKVDNQKAMVWNMCS